MNHKFQAVILILSLFSFMGCKGQESYGDNYLHLSKIISLPGVKGRIDHLDVNLKDQIVYIAALGNNTLEAVDLKIGKVIHSIPGLNEPQGVCYIPQTKEVLVANGGNGDCYFFNTTTFSKTATIHLRSDADDVHYDSAEGKIYVGYGRGGIAVINAATHQSASDIKLPCHPEGFQIDHKNGRLYLNLQETGEIGVVDIKKFKLINAWSKNYRRGNFPMALDTTGNRLFIGYRHPGKLVVMDTRTGNRVSVSDLTNDSDDLFYDEQENRVYVSCGGGYTLLGYINIFQVQGNNKYREIAKIATRNGARTSLLIPQLNLFVVAESSVYTHDGELMVYKISR